MEIEKEESSEYSHLNKYFRDDDKPTLPEPAKVKMISEDITIPQNNFNNNFNSSNENTPIDFKPNNKETEKDLGGKSPKATKAKQEYLKSIDDDSLTLDSCTSVNRDWGKK